MLLDVLHQYLRSRWRYLYQLYMALEFYNLYYKRQTEVKQLRCLLAYLYLTLCVMLLPVNTTLFIIRQLELELGVYEGTKIICQNKPNVSYKEFK